MASSVVRTHSPPPSSLSGTLTPPQSRNNTKLVTEIGVTPRAFLLEPKMRKSFWRQVDETAADSAARTLLAAVTPGTAGQGTTPLLAPKGEVWELVVETTEVPDGIAVPQATVPASEAADTVAVKSEPQDDTVTVNLKPRDDTVAGTEEPRPKKRLRLLVRPPPPPPAVSSLHRADPVSSGSRSHHVLHQLPSSNRCRASPPWCEPCMQAHRRLLRILPSGPRHRWHWRSRRDEREERRAGGLWYQLLGFGFWALGSVFWVFGFGFLGSGFLGSGFWVFWVLFYDWSNWDSSVHDSV